LRRPPRRRRPVHLSQLVTTEVRFLVCHTGDTPPEHVRATAAEHGVEFAALDGGEEDVVSRLSELRPRGFLVNDPGWHRPYLSAELIDAAGSLELVTYMGATMVAEDYAQNVDLDAL